MPTHSYSKLRVDTPTLAIFGALGCTVDFVAFWHIIIPSTPGFALVWSSQFFLGLRIRLLSTLASFHLVFYTVFHSVNGHSLRTSLSPLTTLWVCLRHGYSYPRCRWLDAAVLSPFLAYKIGRDTRRQDLLLPYHLYISDDPFPLGSSNSFVTVFIDHPHTFRLSHFRNSRVLPFIGRTRVAPPQHFRYCYTPLHLQPTIFTSSDRDTRHCNKTKQPRYQAGKSSRTKPTR